MTAVERLEAAIAKLEQLKADSTPGPWDWQHSSVHGGQVLAEQVVNQPGVSGDFTLVSADTYLAADCHLIVTLHRTIDAQLDLLRAGLEVISEVEADPNAVYSDGRRMSGGRILKMSPEGRALIGLADAILGDNS